MTATTTPQGYAVDACRSASCGAPIVWASTTAGELMPVDAAPVEGGNVELVPPVCNPQRAALPVAIVHDPAQPSLFGGDRWVAHFTTCPDADRWRRK
jgi:hypothetical protein